MKFIKIALIIAFSFISLQGIAPSIKNLCTIKQTHTIKKQGFNRDESEYIDFPYSVATQESLRRKKIENSVKYYFVVLIFLQFVKYFYYKSCVVV